MIPNYELDKIIRENENREREERRKQRRVIQEQRRRSRK